MVRGKSERRYSLETRLDHSEAQCLRKQLPFVGMKYSDTKLCILERFKGYKTDIIQVELSVGGVMVLAGYRLAVKSRLPHQTTLI